MARRKLKCVIGFRRNQDGRSSTWTLALEGPSVTQPLEEFYNGQWAWGFCCQKLVNGAKLKALAFGLERAWEQLIEKLTVETDLNNVFRYLNVDIDDSHPYCQTIVQCRILIHKPWTSHAKCVPREVNSVADCLAKFGHDYGGRKHNLFGSSLGGSVSVCVIFLGFCFSKTKQNKTKKTLLSFN